MHSGLVAIKVPDASKATILVPDFALASLVPGGELTVGGQQVCFDKANVLSNPPY
jgi:hypothetical protein